MSAQGQGQAPAQAGPSCMDRFKNISPETLGRVMKVLNIVNAILLTFTGIWAFFGNLDILVVLAALYVIVFSLILLFWEFKMEMCNICFLKNMGFMFQWQGRLLFFIFVGTLAFGLGLVGIIIGSFTFVNAAWNVTVICVHPKYFDALREKADKELRGALVMEAARYGANQAGVDPEMAQDAAGIALEHESELKEVAHHIPAAAAALPTGWEQRTDEHSGTPYWVNTATGEQSWEKPN